MENKDGQSDKSAGNDPSQTKEDTSSKDSVRDLEHEVAEELGVEVPASETPQPVSQSTIVANVQPNQQPAMPVKQWLFAMNWRANPFIFTINPELIVGYTQQKDRILVALEERHKFLLILGPTGSGKTTILKWLESKSTADVLYIGKPPQQAEEFVKIFSGKYKRPWYAFWQNKMDSLYQVPAFLNKKIGKKHFVILMDEAHEASTEVLEWLRVFNDQVSGMSIVLSGLPVFEDELKNNLETFSKRITAKIELLSLTKEETRELINKRILNVGGHGDEFDHIIDSIYDYTGGFPREIIRLCDELVNNAITKGRTRIEFDAYQGRIERKQSAQAVTPTIIEKMTPMQRDILEMLSKKPLTPGQIANSLQLEKYKSRQHAVRSVNNIVKALQEEGYLERKKEDKAYVYSLSPRISTLFVKR